MVSVYSALLLVKKLRLMLVPQFFGPSHAPALKKLKTIIAEYDQHNKWLNY